MSVSGHEQELVKLASRRLLRRADWKSVERYGLSAMEQGDVRPWIVDLACVSCNSDDVDELIRKALDASRLAYPTYMEALDTLLLDIAREVESGTLAPHQAASDLAAYARTYPVFSERLNDFFGLEDEYETAETTNDVVGARAEVEALIRQTLRDAVL